MTAPTAPPAGRLAIVILTLNEAAQLERCMARFPKGLPVFVVDSGSTDGTAELAARLGATVFHNPWPGFAGQRNFALAQLDGFEWCLFVDADELYAPAFFDWLDRLAIAAPADVYQVSSRLVLQGRLLRHAPGYPIYHPRLARVAGARFVQSSSGHGETVAEGLRIGFVDIPYEHHFADAGMTAWLAKHVRLARMEVSAGAADDGVKTWRTRLSMRLGRSLLRAPLRFVYHYLVAQGFRDGRAGFRYAMMYSWYELTKWLSDETG
jgi:glycosyltransferase involved in cell wall biosynthesis